VLHVAVADPDGPDIGAGLQNHQDADQRIALSQQHDRQIAGERDDDGQPDILIRRVLMLLRAPVPEHDDQQAQQGEGNVAVDAPGQGRHGAGPLILRKQAEEDAGGGQQIDPDGQVGLALDVIALAPDEIQDDIEDGHGDGGDQLADAQRGRITGQAGGAEGDGPGHQVEGISASQHDGHQAVEAVLGNILSLPHHADAEGDDGGKIDDVKQCFKDCLHGFKSFLDQ